MTIFWSFEQSNRRTDGGVQPSGSHNAPDTQRIYNFPSKIKSAPAATNASAAHIQNSVAATPLTSRHGRLNSGGESRQFFLDYRELLAGSLFFLVPLLAAVIVMVSAFVYAALVL